MPLQSLTKIGGKRVGFAFLKYLTIYLPDITSYQLLQEYKLSLTKEERKTICCRFLAFIANWHYSLRETAIEKMMAFITREYANKAKMKAKSGHSVSYGIPMTRFRAILYEYRAKKLLPSVIIR